MNLYLATALMLFGCVVHFVETLAVLEEAGEHLTPWAYLKQHPYRALSMVLTAFILLLVINAAGELSKVAAVLIGYTCQNAADRIRQRANARMNQ